MKTIFSKAEDSRVLVFFFLPFLQSLSSTLPILFCSPVSHNRCCCSLISRFLISTPTMRTSLALQSKYMDHLFWRHCQDFLFICLAFFYNAQNTIPEVWQWGSRLQSPKHAGPCSFSISTMLKSVPFAGESSPSSQAWFHWSWSLCLSLESHTFQDTEMDIGGLSSLLLMHTLGAVILCETVLLTIMDVTEFWVCLLFGCRE